MENIKFFPFFNCIYPFLFRLNVGGWGMAVPTSTSSLNQFMLVVKHIFD